MYTEVDVFVGNYTLIDPEIYQLWIEGCSCKFSKLYIPSVIYQIFYKYLVIKSFTVAIFSPFGVS